MNINDEESPATETGAPESSGASPPGLDPAVASVARDLGKMLTTLTASIGGVVKAFAQVALNPQVFDKFWKNIKDAAPNMEKFGKLLSYVPDVLGPVTKTFSDIGQMTAKLTSTFSSLRDSIASMGKGMTEFVGAINPGLVQMFQLAMRDITAVIGQAFGPALHEITQLIQEAAAIFQPLFAKLAPVFGELYDALTDLASSLMQMLKPVLEAVVPILSFFGELIRALTLAILPAVQIFKALYTAIAPLITGMLEALKPAIQLFVRTLLMAAAYLMRLFGQKDMAKDMAKQIDPNQEKERQRLQGFAAVQNVQVTDVSAYSKKMLTAVASAGMGADNKKKSSEEWLEKLSKDLNEIADGNNESFVTLKKDIIDALEKLGTTIVTALKGEVYNKGSQAWNLWQNRGAIAVGLMGS